MLIKYNTTRGLQILKSQVKPIIGARWNCAAGLSLAVLFRNFSRTFIFSSFPVAGFRIVNTGGGGLVTHL